MKTEVMSRVSAFVASLVLAVAATFGVGVSMTSSGDQAWTEASVKAAASSAVAKSDAAKASPTVSTDGQSLSAWKAPATTTSRQVM